MRTSLELKRELTAKIEETVKSNTELTAKIDESVKSLDSKVTEVGEKVHTVETKICLLYTSHNECTCRGKKIVYSTFFFFLNGWGCI